ncbi:hypothetical protein [Acetobacter sicerae]|uniref:hypothetical protein n=1 Tax=Acetobacter sicerae TaxID=85325 RepID=UPI00156B7E8A|nr:hypothetical protein [Acetobacter sicerae]NHN93456.1 hypothetical protein [Acetobacter sicerae]
MSETQAPTLNVEIGILRHRVDQLEDGQQSLSNQVSVLSAENKARAEQLEKQLATGFTQFNDKLDRIGSLRTYVTLGISVGVGVACGIVAHHFGFTAL